MTEQAKQAVTLIKQHCPDFTPKIGIILGSGLGALADKLENATTIDYSELPGFPQINVQGHAGQLCLGYLNKTPVAFLKGRKHPYEGDSSSFIKTYIRTLKLLGCEVLLCTNAAGSLRDEIDIGQLVLVTDHINFQPGNPLVGPNDDEFGPRFLPMDNAYDPKIQNQLLASAKELELQLHEGVYLATLGPNYETAAEIQAFRFWGADVIGMSTVAEVLVARHCGLRVGVISTVTNLATGLSSMPHDHESVLESAKVASKKLSDIITHFADKYA